MTLTAQVTTFPFGTHDPRPLTMLAEAGIACRPSPHGRKHTSAETQALLGDVDILIAGTEPLTAAVLTAGLPRLKHIAKVGVGLDGVDIRFCMANGIGVSYTPDAPARSVVEQVFGVLVTLSRRFHEAHAAMRRGEWARLSGPLWTGRTLGILGCGRIGRQVAEIASTWRMRVLAHDLVEDRTWADPLGVRYVGFEELLANSDAVTCHLPLTPATRHLIDADALARMRPDAYLINTCRGPVVQETALVEALAAGHLGGAAIDVYEQEPYRGPLSDFDNVFLTCHQGSCSFEGRLAMETGAAENAIRFVRGQALDPERIVWLPGMTEPTVPLFD